MFNQYSVVNADIKRGRNVVIFGLHEEGPNEKLWTRVLSVYTVSEMMKELIEDVSCLRYVVRIGAAGSGSCT